MKKNKKIIKVGFDLDGVLLYNPARIFRPIIYFLKKYFLKRDVEKFYYPKTKLEQLIWLLLHKSSLFLQPGIKEIKDLIKQKKIKAYIVSARYEFLEKDFWSWVKKIDKEKLFSGYFFNKNNEQPHLYKARMIKKLGLDIFVEDNWDIVKKLKSKNPACWQARQKSKIYWIYNVFDRWIEYPNKYPSLKDVVMSIKKTVENNKKKILIVSDFYYPHWTGISKSIYNLVLSLNNQFDFTILTVKFKKELKDCEEYPKNVKIIREKYILSFSRVKYSVSLIFKFFKIIKNYDIIFLNSPLSNILPLSVITKIHKKKLLIFHQGDLILPKGFFNKFIEKIFDISTIISFFLADKISTYTDDYAKHSRVMKFFLKKFQPMILPVLIQKKIKKDSVYKKLKKLKNEGKIIFGFGGRFVEEKGFDVLFNAIPQVIKKLPNAYFVFAGETNITYEKTFNNLKSKISKIKPYLTFLGLLDDNKLLNFYKMVDFIIIPSRSDCFNLFQAEAMLFSKPSIVSNIPGARYLVKKTDFGLIFDTENPSDLAEKIILAVKKRAELNKNYIKLTKILDKKNIYENIRRYFNN